MSVEYVLEEGHPRVWHHADLSAELRLGDPVRVHEEYYVPGAPFGWLNVVVISGLGPVPTPAHPSAWADEVTGGVQDLGTGRGLAVDWRSTDGEGSAVHGVASRRPIRSRSRRRRRPSSRYRSTPACPVFAEPLS